MKTSNAKFFNKLAFITMVTMFAAGTGMSVQAATATSDLAVSASVQANCVINTSPLSFGNYDPVGSNTSANLDGTGTINVACTTGSTASIALDNGTNSDGSSRRMTDGTHFLAYELYQEPSRTNQWSSGTGNEVAATANGLSVPYTVYGRIASNQNVPVGTYSDTVVATVTF